LMGRDMSFTDIADDVTAKPDPAPEMAENDTHLYVQEQAIDDPLRDYVRMLTEKHPFAFDIKVDERHIVSNLAVHWPHEPEWTQQAQRLWKCIDQVVQAIPAIKTAPLVLLRVSIASTPLVPTSIPSPESFSTLATFDAVGGKLYHCVLPGMKDLPPLDASRYARQWRWCRKPLHGSRGRQSCDRT